MKIVSWIQLFRKLICNISLQKQTIKTEEKKGIFKKMKYITSENFM